MRLLVVEDVADVGEAIVAALERLGHAIDWARDGEEAEALARAQEYGLIVLDVMLPRLDGFSLLKALRRRGVTTPVLVLTARSQIEDRVSALDLGADDYLVKPFDFRELEARVRALLRRRLGSATSRLECGGLVLDQASRSATLDGRPLDLTRRELTLLEILAARPGRVFGKDELIEQLFGLDDEPSENAVEQYIGRLRRKITGARAEIRTLRGLGYQLVAL
ncbi:MAG: response regulator transcription factor [Hyphomicrobiales bacterium]|uniref:response regulator transcription factor n=1 Tax=Rhabdaerophilum calidifontis TaxID=2604328 RepID=UPI001238651D|nr:response regulator transcription factor [Rhabdaerophilum calidifontis]MCA1951984.1 response regulator transcription factor [Hyphomicrobiales bacterium]MCA1998718.1 response regulator transcription factor [Hyphomicrobiales bacterium]